MSQNGSTPSQTNAAFSVSVVFVWIVPSAFTSTSVCLNVNPSLAALALPDVGDTITHGMAPHSDPVDAS